LRGDENVRVSAKHNLNYVADSFPLINSVLRFTEAISEDVAGDRRQILYEARADDAGTARWKRRATTAVSLIKPHHEKARKPEVVLPPCNGRFLMSKDGHSIDNAETGGSKIGFAIRFNCTH
jgi:hypothetical protein